MTRFAILTIFVSCIAGLHCLREAIDLCRKYRAVFAVRYIPCGKTIEAKDVEVFYFGPGNEHIEMVGYQSNVESVIGQVAEKNIHAGQQIVRLKTQFKWHKCVTGASFSHGDLILDIKSLKRNHSGRLQIPDTIGYLYYLGGKKYHSICEAIKY